MLGVQVAPAAAKRQARDADGRHHAQGRGKAESLCFTVEFSELESRFGAHGPPGGIDADALHGGQVYHDAAVADRLARDAVAAAADRNQNLIFAGEAHALDHVGSARAAGDEGRPAVDHGVGQGTGQIIARLSGTEGLTAKRLAQLLDRRFG